MGQLDASIVTVALPRMAAGLDAGIGAIEWVSLTYVLVLVALLTPVGVLADAVGRKSLYVGGFAIFTVASAGCAVAPDLPVLVVCRAVQAVGAALLQANSIALIAGVVAPHRLGRAVGIQAAAQAVGLALGPVLGGALLALGSWRLLFVVNIPMGVLGCLTGAALLPRSRGLVPPRRIDPLTLVTFVSAVGMILGALSILSGQRHRLLALPMAGSGAAAAVVVARHQKRRDDPLIARSVSRAAGLAGGLVAGLLGYAALFGTLVVVPLFLSRSGVPGPARIGLELAALPGGIGLIAPIAGAWADRRSATAATAGLAIAAGSFALLAVLRPTGGGLVAVLGVLGIGLGSFLPANNRRVMLAAPPGAAGSTAGLLNMARGLGTAVGTAMAVASFSAAGGAAEDGLSVAAAGFAVCCLAAAACARHR
jgi:MFS family permease